MKPTEFRIGNLLVDRLTGSLLMVSELTDKNIVSTVIDRSKFPLPDGWKAVPIPLTYSWMKKLGFDTMDYEIDVIEWGMSDDPYFSIEQSGVPPEDKPYMFTYDVGMGETEIEVKFVHELQNLYFAIKRKELVNG